MTSTSRFKDLKDFQNNHKAKDAKAEDGITSIPATHTRIPNQELGVYGGSWVIPSDKLSDFYELYTHHVFVKNKPEYLTEKQLQNEKSPLLLDFDFKYKSDVITRQHTEIHIKELVRLYLDEIKEIQLFNGDDSFPVYVMEKPDVNRLTDGTSTKDGIHIYFGIQMNHTLQIILREKMLDILSENDILKELPLTNNWDNILDITISRGTTNWQLYGSQKPGNQAYKMTYWYEVSFDTADGEIMMEDKVVSDFDFVKNFYKLSAQYDGNLALPINPRIKQEYDKRLKSSLSRPKPKLVIVNSGNMDPDAVVEVETDDDYTYDKIVNPDILKKALDYFIRNLKQKEYIIKEIHDYALLLPDIFYKPGSHIENRHLAFALKHLSYRLDNDKIFLIWVAVRAKADDFDYNTIPDLYKMWTRHFKERPDGYTERSIIYWAKQYCFDDYMKVKKTTIDYYVELTEDMATDHDLAMVLHQMYKDVYVCGSKKYKSWSRFCEHRWKEDPNMSLRLEIPTNMNVLYREKIENLVNEVHQYDDSDENYERINMKISVLSKISTKIRFGSSIDSILKSAADIFCDEHFMEMRDSNKHLMCFTNGVIDFTNKCFRDGYPQDYITKSTGIPYVPYDEEKNGEIMNEINTFWSQLFPIKELGEYMWDHCSSVLIGENINQTFNIYTGSGSNGKSMLVDLMGHALGEYKGTVPSTLVTGRRTGLGGTCSEVVQLKGIRYAVMQELSKNEGLNEGVMKELTGGDPITARALYCEAETFIPQFGLVVCTNNLPEIRSNDDGTWRRIRICPFNSKFVDEYVEKTEEEKELDRDIPAEEKVHVFLKDKNLKKKLPVWAPVFMGMLINRVFKTKGHVADCDIVMSYSNKYRQGQDNISAFVNESIRKKVGSKIKLQELVQQFKIWNDTKILPKGTKEEIQLFMDKKFGRRKTGDSWHNVEIIYPDADIDEVNDFL